MLYKVSHGYLSAYSRIVHGTETPNLVIRMELDGRFMYQLKANPINEFTNNQEFQKVIGFSFTTLNKEPVNMLHYREIIIP